ILPGGSITARVRGNVLSGNHRYPLIISGGQTTRQAAVDYSGVLDLDFKDNEWLAAPAGTISRILITFTNSRMGIRPFWQELATTQEYIEGSTYRLRHHGELDACLGGFSFDCHVDNPEI